jgi:hypothetical protein
VDDPASKTPVTSPAKSKVRRLLGRKLWQGVAALVGIVGVLVTIGIYLLQGSDQPTTQGNVQSGHGNIQAGNGNCFIQGGSDNNCQLTPATPSPAADPLAVDPLWPTVHPCDGGTETAMLPGGADPNSLPMSATEDLRKTMVQKGGASFGTGHLYLEMTVVDDSTVQIEDIRPLFFKAAPLLPSWVYNPEGGCGDTYSRFFDLNLDQRTFVDRGLPPYAPDPAPSAARGEPLGPSFHVSKDDPAEVRIDTFSCNATYYEWGIQLTYVAAGRTHTKNIGSPDAPFRSVGSGDSEIPAYTRSTATKLTPALPAKSACHPT